MRKLRRWLVGTLAVLMSTTMWAAEVPEGTKASTANVEVINVEDEKQETKQEVQQFKSYEQLVALLKEGNHFYKQGETEDNGRFDTYPNTQDIVASGVSVNNYSQTNTQVQGVDEADTMKVDGRYIYTCVNYKSVAIVDTKDGMKQVGKIGYEDGKYNVNYYVDKIFVDGDVLITVLSSTEKTLPSRRYRSRNYGVYSTVQIYDISDRSNPIFKRQVKIEGDLSEIRKIGNKIYMVAKKDIGYYEEDKYVKEDILPTYRDSAVSNETQTIAATEIMYYEWSRCNTYTVITSFNINDQEAAQFNVLMGNVEELYMNQDQIYLTEACYSGKEPYTTGYSYYTYITRYDIQQGKIKYGSYGKVPGEILNQFSMDEYEGYFRIATTSNGWIDSHINRSNNVYVLDKNLNIVSKLEGLAKGESIYSVRFEGNRGYVVTFQQVDPLFVIDLSQPNAPKVLGELKVPGFSQYLHPIGDNLVVGIGRSTVENIMRDENGKERVTGVLAAGIKLSLFDVTNPKAPVEINNIVLGTQGSYSEALDSHTAVMVDANRHILAIPVSLRFNELVRITETTKADRFYGAYVFGIENGKLVGKAKLGKINAVTGEYEGYELYGENRVCYIGDTMYYVYNKQINAYNIDTFQCKKVIILK